MSSGLARLSPERLWIALFVLLPLAYNPVSRWQYEPDKADLALALAGLLVGWSLARGELPWRGATRAEWVVGGYLLVRLLATANSVAPHWSVWGDPAWRNGLGITLVGVVLFGLARRQLSTPGRWRVALTALLLGSAVVAGYGVLQYAGLDPLGPRDPVRVPSTLAHPNLLAAYLAMMMPLTAARLLIGPRRAWTAALLALQVTCLVFTYSRAGWLAAAGGLAVLGIAALWGGGRRRAAGLLTLAGAVGLAGLVALSVAPPPPADAPHVLHTLTSLFRWQGATAQIRLLGWRACVDAIRARPWLGYGPATSRAVMEWFVPPELAPFGGAPALGGRPHNVFLEVALESGLIGLGGLLVALGAVLSTVLRALREDGRGPRWLRAGMLGALAANLVTYIFSLESATTAVLFWSLAGMASAVPEAEPSAARARPRLGWTIGVGSVLLAVYLTVPDVAAFASESLAIQGRWSASTAVLGLAGRLSPTPEVFLMSQGSVHAAWATATGDGGTWGRGAAVYDRLVERGPDMTEHWRARGLYFRRWSAAGGGTAAARQAIASYTEAIRLSPDDPDLWLDRGLAWLQAGDLERALGDIQRGGALLGDYTRFYGAMSVAALAQGDQAEALAWQERALGAQQAWDAWSWRR